MQPASQYAAAVANLRQQFASVSAAARDAGIQVDGGDAYLKTVQLSIGHKLLSESGVADATDKDAFTRGQVATQDWLKDHDVKVDPSLGIAFAVLLALVGVPIVVLLRRRRRPAPGRPAPGPAASTP